MLFCIAPALAQKRAPVSSSTCLPSKRRPDKAKLTLGSYRSIVESASLEKYAPTPGDRANYGTCVAFATAYHLRTILWPNRTISPIGPRLTGTYFPQHLFMNKSRTNRTRIAKVANPILALELMKNVGIATLNTLPYSCGGDVTIEALLEGMDFRISDYQVLFMPDEADNSVKINTTKKALAEGLSGAFGLHRCRIVLRCRCQSGADRNRQRAIWRSWPACALRRWF